MQDSVVRLRTLLRRRWDITFQASPKPVKVDIAIDDGSARDAWRGSGRWTFNVNHRHGIYEGNTLLNFAGEQPPHLTLGLHGDGYTEHGDRIRHPLFDVHLQGNQSVGTNAMSKVFEV